MQIHLPAGQQETTGTLEPRPAPSCCPLCNGPLIPVQLLQRCLRCTFTICVGCDCPETAPAEDY